MGTDVMVLKIFSPKKLGEKIGRKNWRFLAQTTATYLKNSTLERT
jgi:hypothetical protein